MCSEEVFRNLEVDDMGIQIYDEAACICICMLPLPTVILEYIVIIACHSFTSNPHWPFFNFPLLKIKYLHQDGEGKRYIRVEKACVCLYLPSPSHTSPPPLLYTNLPWLPQCRWLVRQSAAGHPGVLPLLSTPLPRSTSCKEEERVAWIGTERVRAVNVL